MSTVEWQVASGSTMAHLVDTGQVHPSRSGPRALCGRYPQRNLEYPWWALSVDEPGVEAAMMRMWIQQCADCAEVKP